ncbi:hypothetical protein BDV12DRAFT_167574 [Aspergillus spectabilis]
MRRPLCRLSSLALSSLRTRTFPNSCRPFSRLTPRMESADSHELAIPYLYSPLPDELPIGVYKDLLLLYAAYVGNIDRYVRLRDPNHFIDYEFDSVIRGIYHDTMFAKWWSLQPDHPDFPGLMSKIRSAIHARFIMNNDLSHIDKETSEKCFPYVIWHPHFAEPETYEELARRKPAMKAQAARACIMADYEDAYKRINPTPDWFLVEQARRREATTPFYLEDLLRRAEEMGVDVSEDPGYPDEWKIWEERPVIFWRSSLVRNEVSPSSLVGDWDYNKIYDDFGVDMSPLEVFVSASDELRARAKSEGRVLDLTHMYRQARPQGES